MSKYTTQLRYICESFAGLTESVGADDTDAVIAAALPKICDFDFPIFDPAYRNTLLSKIFAHYYTREIAYETYGLWKFKLKTLLREIMPLYNQYYESALLAFNPLLDTSMTRTYNKKNDSVQAATGETNVQASGTSERDDTTNTQQTSVKVGESTTNNQDKFSDTPQGYLNDVDNSRYLTEYRNVESVDAENVTDEMENDTTLNSTATNTNTSDTTSAANATINTLEEYTETVSGKQGGKTYAALLKEFRETFINTDMDVIRECEQLFLCIW